MCPHAELPIVVRTAVAEALALLFPVDCAGCAAPGRSLCESCTQALRPRPLSRTLTSGLRVHSAVDFAREPAAVIRVLKDQGRAGLARALAPALEEAMAQALSSSPSTPVRAVPVPTSPAAMRRRGLRIVELVMRRAGVRASRELRVVRSGADQRGLDRASRKSNVHRGLQARRPLNGVNVIIVDDVVTTGATIEEARRALQAAGARVIAAVTIAQTPRWVTRHDTAGINA